MTKLAALCFLGVLVTQVSAAVQSGPAAGSLDASINKEEELLELRYNGRRLLLYAFATNQLKPYVRELYTLQGDNILLDAPADHLHHHGLMYGIRVNDVNFWEERDQPGYQRSVEVLPPQIGRTPAGLPQASFAQLIHWVSSQHASAQDTTPHALLVERRELKVTIDAAQQEVALAWQAEFQVGAGAPKVTLTGASYHGLGMRFGEPFNRVARHRNSEGAPYPSNGTGDVTAARWSSVSHNVAGRDITAALFGLPSPGRGLPLFFTMVQPFTYLSVTQGLDKAPIEYTAGDKFRLDYLLVLYSKECTPEMIQRRYQLWKP